MNRLPRLNLPRPSDWWVDTLVMACVYLPVGSLYGVSFVSNFLNGELVGTDFTPLGLFVVLSPAATSLACFATVALRLLHKPSAWLGTVSVGLVLLTVFPFPIMFLLALPAFVSGWFWVGVAALAVATWALTILVDRLYPPRDT